MALRKPVNQAKAVENGKKKELRYTKLKKLADELNYRVVHADEE